MKKKLKPLVGLCILSLMMAAAWLPGEKVRSADQGRPTPGMAVYTPAETSFLVLPILQDGTPHPVLQDDLTEGLALPGTPTPPQLTETEITPTVSDTPAATPTWVWNPPGSVVAPILLYHHVAWTNPPNRYYVSPADFEDQMSRLQAWGYTPIPLSLLVEAMMNGAELPPHPVVITFDDGYLDVYKNAFPIMQRFGFPGVAYIIVDQLEIKGYLHADHLEEMLTADWEIGSHTLSHSDLRQENLDLRAEISGSRQTLEEVISASVKTFSFPYGVTSPLATYVVKDSGYESAVGLGGMYTHADKTPFYLSRIEVQGDFDLQTFASLLPWAGHIPDWKQPFLADR